ncbi:MAG: kynureninase [Bacteroidia bacterium]
MQFQNTLAFAQQLDREDKLHSFRDRFHQLQHNGKPVIYLCGNSLGLQPKNVKTAIDQELKDWAELAVEAHFKGKNPWMYYHHFLDEKAAKVVGAKPSEVVVMNNLTANLHLMMVSFYRPTKTRYKILMEVSAFPSDQYAMESQARFHNLDPDDVIIELKPREEEFTIRTEDIIAKISEHKDDLAIVMMGGVNYYTGQAFDMQAITKAAHEAGAVAGFDLAHGAGNLLLQLHDWDVDFAVWCTYKYLNSGPGGTSGVFVNERHGKNKELIRFAGWWGYDEKERFKMKKGFVPMEGAAGWQLSNAQIFPMAIHKASLEIFDEAGMENLRTKSELLTGYLEFILKKFNDHLQIITPRDISERGCQLSIRVNENGKKLFDFLVENNVLPDWREPDVMRMSPVPLYNSFEEVYRVGEILKEYFKK